MARNKALEHFLKYATDEEWQALADLINSSNNRSRALPNEEFEFSYSAIAPHLEERGLITRRSRQSKEKNCDDEKENKKFTLDGYQKPENRIRRSVDYDVLIYERIESMSCEYQQYSKTLIINKLLDEGLKKYGF